MNLNLATLILLASVPIATAAPLQPLGAATPMTASLLDGASRIVIIVAGSTAAPQLREQRDELLKHVEALDERDMVVLVALPDNVIEPIHGRAPTSSDLGAVSRLLSSEARSSQRFAVLLIGKDGGVKLRSEKPVRAQELFALIDTMPMRRQEMRR